MRYEDLFSRKDAKTQRKTIPQFFSFATLRLCVHDGFPGFSFNFVDQHPGPGDFEPDSAGFRYRHAPQSRRAGGAARTAAPREAYQGALRPDLADILVFNGNGEPVPVALIPPAAATVPQETRQLPIFALAAQESGTGTGVNLRVRTDAAGAIIDLATGPGTRGNKGPATYILDASGLDRPVAGLELRWSAPAGNYLGSVRVDTSDDLRNWTHHADGAVANLLSAGEPLERRLVEFSAIKAKYYRLTLTPEGNAPGLTAAVARLAPAEAEPVRQWLSLVAIPAKGRPGEFLVDTAGHYPVDRLRLHFPEENTIVRVTVSSRPDDKSLWTVRHEGRLYRLRQGETALESPAMAFPATTDCLWLVRVEEKGGGLGNGMPRMEMGWLPHRLVFAARGPAPFLLAWGSAREDLCSLRDNTFPAEVQARQKELIRPAPANAGPVEELGGKAALRPRIPATTWKKVTLWGILSLGVLLLAGMAIRLWREMNASTDNRQ